MTGEIGEYGGPCSEASEEAEVTLIGTLSPGTLMSRLLKFLLGGTFLWGAGEEYPGGGV